jgi:hypothetical protein
VAFASKLLRIMYWVPQGEENTGQADFSVLKDGGGADFQREQRRELVNGIKVFGG